MPRHAQGPRLWLRKARKDGAGIVRRSVWLIRDGNNMVSTGFGPRQAEQAQTALANYILARTSAPRDRDRDPAQIPVADVISVYADDVLAKHARPKETTRRLDRVLDYFGEKTLDVLNARTCAGYAKQRGKPAAARRELEDLRAAVRHHFKQGYSASLVPVVLPEDTSMPRERWLTRREAARLLKTAWRRTQKFRDGTTSRLIARHIARFMIIGLYTGTRASAICGAALMPMPGKGHLDLDAGVFYRRAQGKRETKKRQPPIRIPPRALAHLRRWQRLGISKRFAVEWNGKPVARINKGWRSLRAEAGLGDDVVPHTLRHTAVTWQAQRGVPEHEILGFFGLTRETFERVYAHHHPDHQSSAVNALSGPQGGRGAKIVNLRGR